jgi:annexin A7/11
LILLPH